MALLSLCLLTHCDEGDVYGCADLEACNYNPNATKLDGSCNFICLSAIEQKNIRNFIDSAILCLETYGKDSAYSIFEQANGPFRQDEKYIFVWNDSAKVLSNGLDPTLVGTSFYDNQNFRGKYYARELIRIGKGNSGTGWEWHFFKDTISLKIRKKFTFVAQHRGVFIASSSNS